MPGDLHIQLCMTGLDVFSPSSQGSKYGIVLCPENSERAIGRSENPVELSESWHF